MSNVIYFLVCFILLILFRIFFFLLYRVFFTFFVTPSHNFFSYMSISLPSFYISSFTLSSPFTSIYRGSLISFSFSLFTLIFLLFPLLPPFPSVRWCWWLAGRVGREGPWWGSGSDGGGWAMLLAGSSALRFTPNLIIQCLFNILRLRIQVVYRKENNR